MFCAHMSWSPGPAEAELAGAVEPFVLPCAGCATEHPVTRILRFTGSESQAKTLLKSVRKTQRREVVGTLLEIPQYRGVAGALIFYYGLEQEYLGPFADKTRETDVEAFLYRLYQIWAGWEISSDDVFDGVEGKTSKERLELAASELVRARRGPP